MALTWTFDLVGSAWRETLNSIEYRRNAKAIGFVESDVPAMFKELYDDAGFPALYEQLDATDWDDMLVAEREVTRIDCAGAARYALLTITYRQQSTSFNTQPNDNGPVVTTVSSNVVETDTSEDRNDTALTTSHENETKAATVPFLEPVTVLECRRVEATNPRSRSDTYVGKVNSATWNGYAARTVLCSDINTTTDDFGASYDTTYRFEYRANGWDPTIVHKKPSGDPVLNPVDTVGIKVVELYDEVSFAPLNITIT